MPTPSRVGTASQVDASGGDGNINVTVPLDITLIVALWAHADNNQGSFLSALSLNNIPFTIVEQLSEGVILNEGGTGVALLETSLTGTQNLAWTWSNGGSRAEGGWIILVYIKDHRVGDPYSDTQLVAEPGGTDTQITLADATANELIIAAGQSTNFNPVLSGTLFINNVVVNIQHYDATETLAVGNDTITLIDGNFATIAGISLKRSADINISGILLSQPSSLSATYSTIPPPRREKPDMEVTRHFKSYWDWRFKVGRH